MFMIIRAHVRGHYFSKQSGENILRDGGTGSDAQFSFWFCRELLHIEIKILIGIDDFAGMV